MKAKVGVSLGGPSRDSERALFISSILNFRKGSRGEDASQDSALLSFAQAHVSYAFTSLTAPSSGLDKQVLPLKYSID